MFPQWILKSTRYKRLDVQSPTEEDSDEESLYLNGKQVVGASKSNNPNEWRLISLFSCTLAIIFALLYFREKTRSAGESYEQGWPTDFGILSTNFPDYITRQSFSGW